MSGHAGQREIVGTMDNYFTITFRAESGDCPTYLDGTLATGVLGGYVDESTAAILSGIVSCSERVTLKVV